MNRLRYNPGLYGNESLIAEFVVRQELLDWIIEILKETSAGPSRHIIVVGPRGIGKTTLVRRAAAEIRTQMQLSNQWYPIVFAEEAYEIGTPGEFWLTALFHLSDQSQEERLLAAYDDIKAELDEARLRERALTELLDFADRERKRIILIVENLNMILGEQLSAHHGWILRHTLQNESRLMLLGTAPARFQEIEHVNKAWFELVTVYELLPLDDTESKILWEHLTATELAPRRLRPIQILTGGNPRLLTILANFAVQTSFRELMDNLIKLIDDHTEYFKGQLDRLAPLERKIFVAVLDLWDPSAASKIAFNARVGVSKASSILGRLSGRGHVTIIKSKSRNLYQASERLYNIYYLMRRRGHPSDRVHAVVAFMVQFYEGEQIIDTAKSLAEEACMLEPSRRRDHFYAYENIMRQLSKSERLKILGVTPPEFFAAPDAPDEVRGLASLDSSNLTEWIVVGNEMLRSGDSFEALAEFIRASKFQHMAWTGFGTAYSKIKNFSKAERCFRNATEIEPLYAEAWEGLGYVYLTNKRYQDAEQAWRMVCNLKPKSFSAALALGGILTDCLKRPQEGESFLRTAIDIEPSSFETWHTLADCLHSQKRYEEAIEALQKTVVLNPESDSAWAQMGHIWGDHLNQHIKAETAYAEALKLNSKVDWVWARMGQILKSERKQYREAESALRTSLSLNPNGSWALAELGDLLAHTLGQREEGERLLQKAVELDPSDIWAWTSLAKSQARSSKHDEAELTLRRAAELNSHSESIWNSLGHFLFGLERYAEAENAFLKVVELNPNAAGALAHIGDIKALLGEYTEAEDVYKKALSYDQSVGWIWTSVGDLYAKLGRHDEAKQAYKNGVDNAPDFLRCSARLITFLLKNGESDGAISYAKKFLNTKGNDYSSLNSMAWLFHENATKRELRIAEDWARVAVEKAPSNQQWVVNHTLASILGDCGRWEEALRLIPDIVNATGTDTRAVKYSTDFIIRAAAQGYAQTALEMLTTSRAQEALEPLLFGLKQVLGQSDEKAQEIVEIGNDVVRRIRELQANVDERANINEKALGLR